MRVMNMMFSSVVLGLACTLAGCGENQTGQTSLTVTDKVTVDNANKATRVFFNGDIYTVNKQQAWAEAVAIKGNKIIYVGSDEQVEQYIDAQTQVIDLKGKMMMPGFHDVHIHPMESGSDATQFTIPAYGTENEYIDAVYDAANNNPSAQWLIGYGHEISTLLEMQNTPLEVLNDAASDRPVVIMEQTSHSMWVNSKALELAGIRSDSVDPVGGVIGRDKSGRLNGILYDNAGELVMEIAMRSLQGSADKDYQGLVEHTMPMLNEVGITSISDARTYWQRGQLDTWQRIADDEKLTLRVALGLWAYPQMNDEVQLEALKKRYQNKADSLLKVNQVKFYMDGILVNTTAAMHDPYHVNILGLYGNKGLNYFTQSRIEKYLKALEPVGFDFNIHAIGDRGITEALNAIEKASSKQNRHRLTHIEVMDPQDYKRFAEIGVIADAQVAGDFTNPNHWPEMIPFLGEERAYDLVPIKSLVESNAMLTLSSDWNVSTYNPFVGIGNAVSRAPQNITLEQAIAAYTINSAYAMRQEQLVGSIESGKLADLIVLDGNLFDMTAAKIKQTQVVMTLLDGEIVYQR